jgi:hypothetical protein
MMGIHDLVQMMIQESSTKHGDERVWFPFTVGLIYDAFQDVADLKSPEYWPRCGMFVSHVRSLTMRDGVYRSQDMAIIESLGHCTILVELQAVQRGGNVIHGRPGEEGWEGAPIRVVHRALSRKSLSIPGTLQMPRDCLNEYWRLSERSLDGAPENPQHRTWSRNCLPFPGALQRCRDTVRTSTGRRRGEIWLGVSRYLGHHARFRTSSPMIPQC